VAAPAFIKVLLADDHEMVRRGVRKMLEREKDIVVVGEAVDGADAVAKALSEFPDIILMDIRMPEMTGIEATKKILEVRPNIGIIILTVYSEDEYVRQAIRAGAVGYLLKDVEATDLVAAIRRVAAGENLIDAGLASRLLKDLLQGVPGVAGKAETLTDREREILDGIASGLANKEIADKLSISERTVKNHITNLFKKIDVHDRTQAALFAVREGLKRLG